MFIFNFKICRSIATPLDKIISVLFKVSLNDHSISQGLFFVHLL